MEETEAVRGGWSLRRRLEQVAAGGSGGGWRRRQWLEEEAAAGGGDTWRKQQSDGLALSPKL